jgi:hypothetical protein
MKRRTPPPSEARTSPRPAASEEGGWIRPWMYPVVFGVLVLALFRAFVFSSDMLLGMDTLSLGYQARVFFARALSETGFPLWNPHILGGTPFLESLAGGDSLHPLSVALLMLLEPYRALGWKLVIHVFLAGIFMVLWLRGIGVSRGGALVGGIGALLAPSFVTLVFPGHDGKMFVIAMTPLLFYLAEGIWGRRPGVQGALLAGAIALVLFSTHFQMAYFLFGALGLWMVFRALRLAKVRGWRRTLVRFSVFFGFSVLGAGIGAVQLLPAIGYVTEFSRRASTTVGAERPEDARAYSASWSLHPEEGMSLLVPEFVGNSAGGRPWTTETYWGRNPFKLNHEYLGILLFALALLAFLPGPVHAQRGSQGGQERGEPHHAPVYEAEWGAPASVDPWTRWFLAGLAAVFALFALGANTPIWGMFYSWIPGISLFRAPSMAIFLTAFALTTLAALGLDRAKASILAGSPKNGELRGITTRLGALAGVLMLLGVLTAAGIFLPVWEAILYPELSPARSLVLDRLTPFIIRGFLFGGLLVAALLGLFHGVAKGKLPVSLLVPAVALLVTVDLFRVSDPFVQVVDPTRVTVPDANVSFLLQRAREEPPFRVFSMVQGGQDVQPSAFGLDLAAGHHPNDLGRYRELIGMEGSGIPENLAYFHPVVARILNVRYILWPDAQYGPLEGVEPLQQIRFADGRPWASVYPYPGLPRARLVGHYRMVEEGAALQTLLEDPTFDPRVETVLEGLRPEIEPVGQIDPETGARLPAGGTVEWVEREADRIVLTVQADSPSLLLLSQNWFPSWTATVSGAATPVLRADHTLQAIAIPAGTHEVVVQVRSADLAKALYLSLLSLLLVTGLGIGSALMGRRISGREQGNESEGESEGTGLTEAEDAPPA